MEYLFANIDLVKKKLDKKNVILFLDYDGTLTPIVSTPEKARLSQQMKRIIESYNKCNRFKVAVVSGRSLADIKQKVGITGLLYVGNHGLEIEGPKLKFKSPVSVRYLNILCNIKRSLEARLATIKGVVIEDKGLSLALHFRMVSDKDVPFVKTVFHEIIILYLVRSKIKTKTGKKVLEVRPPLDWDKGKVVLWLLARWDYAFHQPAVPIYIGDDRTDEDAFKALRKLGVTVRVGETAQTSAQYYVATVAEVEEFLKQVVAWQ